MNGHCAHCAEDCKVRQFRPAIHWSPTVYGVKWLDEHCPMCAERERIAAEIEALNQYDSDHWEWEPCPAIYAAARIARGDA